MHQTSQIAIFPPSYQGRKGTLEPSNFSCRQVLSNFQSWQHSTDHSKPLCDAEARAPSWGRRNVKQQRAPHHWPWLWQGRPDWMTAKEKGSAVIGATSSPPLESLILWISCQSLTGSSGTILPHSYFRPGNVAPRLPSQFFCLWIGLHTTGYTYISGRIIWVRKTVQILWDFSSLCSYPWILVTKCACAWTPYGPSYGPEPVWIARKIIPSATKPCHWSG